MRAEEDVVCLVLGRDQLVQILGDQVNIIFNQPKLINRIKQILFLFIEII